MMDRITIICDGCGEAEHSKVGEKVQQFRAFIKNRKGWSYKGGKDYCPKCTKSENKVGRSKL